MTKRERAECRRLFKKWDRAEFLAFCKHLKISPKESDYNEERHEPSREWKAAFAAGIAFERRSTLRVNMAKSNHWCPEQMEMF